jgi:hypothetical protein
VPAQTAATARYNACEYRLDRRIDASDASHAVITGTTGDLACAQLLDQALRAAGGPGYLSPAEFEATSNQETLRQVA